MSTILDDLQNKLSTDLHASVKRHIELAQTIDAPAKDVYIGVLKLLAIECASYILYCSKPTVEDRTKTAQIWTKTVLDMVSSLGSKAL